MSSSVSLHVTCSWSKASGATPAPSIAKKLVTETLGVTRTTRPGTARAPTQLVAPMVTTSGSAVAWMTRRSPAAVTRAARVSRDRRTGPERPCSGIGASSMVTAGTGGPRPSRPAQVELAVAGLDVLPPELGQLVLAAVELVLDEGVDEVGDPHRSVVRLQPAAQQSLHGPVVRHERHEVEAASQRGVDER